MFSLFQNPVLVRVELPVTMASIVETLVQRCIIPVTWSDWMLFLIPVLLSPAGQALAVEPAVVFSLFIPVKLLPRRLTRNSLPLVLPVTAVSRLRFRITHQPMSAGLLRILPAVLFHQPAGRVNPVLN